MLPDVLAAYRKKHPRVRLLLQPAATPKLLSQMQRNELDLAVVGRVPADADLETWMLIKDEIVMFASRSHPLARKKTVSATALATEDLILRDPTSDTRKLVEHWAQESGAMLHVLMDMW